MANYNRVVLVGNLTRDIELRYTPGGMAVVEVGLAINEKRKSASSGDWVDDTVFVDVTLWGRTAEIASEYLGKGSSVLIEGKLKYDSWETDGKKHSKLRVVGEKIQFLGNPKGSASGGTVRMPDPKGSQQTSASQTSASQTSASQTSASQTSSEKPAANAPKEGAANEKSQPAGESAGRSPSAGGSSPGVREAQPTGDGPGYGDPEIPF